MMSMTILLIVQVLLAISMIALILIQRGRGADTGAAFGSGASTTVFGARGSASFLTRTTAILAILFFTNCFALSYLAGRTVQNKESVMSRVESATVLEDAVKKAADAAAAADAAGSEMPNAGGAAVDAEVPTVKPDAEVQVEAPADASPATAPTN
jgi:preprotein translocase subunit SecG